MDDANVPQGPTGPEPDPAAPPVSQPGWAGPVGWAGQPLAAPPGVAGPAPAYWPAMPPVVPGPLRVWTALAAPVTAIVVGSIVAGVVLAAAAVASAGPEAVASGERLMEWVKTSATRPGGFLVLVLPGQLTFLAVALGAALLSRERFVDRLRLKRPSIPWWAMLLILPGTNFAGVCGDLLMSRLFGDERSDNLELIYGLFRNAGGPFLVLVTVVISVLPGMSEEMLFRGYAQGRLLRRWHPAAAVGVSSLLFAAAHLDPVHVVAVLPLGIWLGVVAWLTGSIWPSVVCHTVNNATAVLLTRSGVADLDDHVRLDAAGLTMLAVTGTFAALAVWVMLKYRARAANEALPRVAPSDIPLDG